MKRWISLGGIGIICLSLMAAQLQSGKVQTANPFLGSPLLMIAILAGLVAAGFAMYSAFQLRGGKMAEVLYLLSLAMMILDLGVIFVTFFAANRYSTLFHDISLLGGFILALYAFYRLRRVVG